MGNLSAFSAFRFQRLGSMRAGGLPPAATDALQTIGALTRVGAGGRSLAVADGVYGPYTVSGGVMTPNTTPVTPGTYDVGGLKITAEPDVYDVGTGEINAVISLGSSALSGKTIKILPGAQANGTAVKSTTIIGTGVTLSSPLTITSRVYGSPGRMRRMSITARGEVILNNILFHDEWLDDAGGDTGIIRCDTDSSPTPVSTTLRIVDCEVSSLSHTTWNFAPAPVTTLEVGKLYKPATITNPDWSAYMRRRGSAGALATAVEPDDLYYCYAAGDLTGLGTAYPARVSLYGITCEAAGANQTRHLVVEDSYIHDLAQGIAGVAGGWTTFTVRRNKIDYTYGDMIGLAYLGNEGVWTIEDNWFASSVQGEVDVFDSHSDDLQINQDFLAQDAVSPVYIRRNRHFNKGGAPKQCIFLATQEPLPRGPIPYNMTAIIEDNIVLSGQASAIGNTLHGAGSVIRRNTVAFDAAPSSARGNVPKIVMGKANGIQLDIRDNLHCGIIGVAGGNPETQPFLANNVQFPSFNSAGFDDYLTGPSFDSSAIASLDAFTAAMLSKGGTAIDTTFPKVGAGQYCTYGVSNLGTKSGLGAGTTTPPVVVVPSAFTAGMWSIEIGSTELTISVTNLPADGGATISAIEYRLSGGAWVSSGIRSRTTFKITGLTNGTSYAVEMRAVNAAGNGPAGDTKTATPTSMFSVTAVEFGSGEYILHSGTSFAATGSKQALISATFQCPGTFRSSDKLIAFLTSSNSDRLSLQFGSSNRLMLNAFDSAGTQIVSFLCATGIFVPDVWYTVVYSIDTTKATSDERMRGYARAAGGSWVNLRTGAGLFTSVQDGIIGDTTRCRMNYTHTAPVYYGDVYASADRALDLTVPANRDLFLPTVDKGSNGQNPTGTAPQVFLSGIPSAYATNKGTAGLLALTGTLSAAPSAPS